MSPQQGENLEAASKWNDAWEIACRVLQSNNQMACRVHGWSMSPFLAYGNIVWLRRATVPELRYGDIVLFTDGQGRHIVHRYLGKRRVEGREVLRIKGDAVAHCDPPVLESEVLAKVVMVRRGKLDLNLEGKAGRLLNILMALLSSCPGLLGTSLATWRLIHSLRLRATSTFGS